MPSMQYPQWVHCLSHCFTCRTKKADQLAKPGNATVYVQCISVAISQANKMEYSYVYRPSVTLVSFLKSSHIFRWKIRYFVVNNIIHSIKEMYICNSMFIGGYFVGARCIRQIQLYTHEAKVRGSLLLITLSLKPSITRLFLQVVYA